MSDFMFTIEIVAVFFMVPALIARAAYLLPKIERVA